MEKTGIQRKRMVYWKMQLEIDRDEPYERKPRSKKR